MAFLNDSLNGSFVTKSEDLEKFNGIINKFVIPSLMMIIGVPSNLLIITYFIRIHCRRLRKMSSYHLLLINLAVADLLTCLGVAVMFYEWSKPSWGLGMFGCRIISPFSTLVSPMASCWLLVLLSYARYRDITQPFAVKLTKMKYTFFCLLIWLLSSASGIFLYHFIRLITLSDGTFICGMIFQGEEELYGRLFYIVIDSIIPITLMVNLYHGIRRSIKSNTPSSNDFPLSEASRQRNKTALKTLRNLIAVYMITICPGRLYNLFHMLIWAVDEELVKNHWFSNLYFFFFAYHYLNNAINIFVYAKLMEDFRRFLLNCFTCGRLKQKPTLGENCSTIT
ncbi:melanin-concentrating hormone receptor 2-like [Clytia hemisphaerica]|uniref:G-protein coupled receptors family 1 profile domain-containing protein n=1 Tax=Clytia hemisphaerica TaxID=252671 RepID=A0A7M5UKD9_9CNID